MRSCPRGATDFNPRSPHGERPSRAGVDIGLRKISIHAPRTGSDVDCSCAIASAPYFNPRSPHGERPPYNARRRGNFLFQSTLPARGATRGRDAPTRAVVFQSTLPARGATRPSCYAHQGCEISIHAPRTGSDARRKPNAKPSADFNPRSPHGERHTAVTDAQVAVDISIHAPRTGSDRQGIFGAGIAPPISIHAPRTGSDRSQPREKRDFHAFQSTLPARGATTCRLDCRTLPCNFNPRSPHGERPALVHGVCWGY